MVFLSLLNSIALLVALSVMHHIIMRRWPTRSNACQVGSGFLFGAVAVVGMRLGLSIAHGFVRDHNGTIDIASEPEQRAVFTINLPLTALR